MPPQIKQDLNRSGWETTDFPSVCEKCLPDNPYVQMLKEDHGAVRGIVTLAAREEVVVCAYRGLMASTTIHWHTRHVWAFENIQLYVLTVTVPLVIANIVFKHLLTLLRNARSVHALSQSFAGRPTAPHDRSVRTFA